MSIQWLGLGWNRFVRERQWKMITINSCQFFFEGCCFSFMVMFASSLWCMPKDVHFNGHTHFFIHWVSYFWFLISCQVTVESQAYHKSCFKCSHGGCPITPSNYAALEGILYCKHHFSQLFKEKGSYNHLIKCASIKRTAATATPVPELWPHSLRFMVLSRVWFFLLFVWWRIINLVLWYASFFSVG